MGKSRKNERKVQPSSNHDNTKQKHGSNRIVRRSHSQTTSSSRKKKAGSSNFQEPPLGAVAKTKTKTRTRAVARPRVPFAEFDRVLCVGEGDFSFALSLATTHNVKHIVATCYDDEETLHRKYPHARRNIARLLGLSEEHVIDNEEPPPPLLENEDSTWQGISPSPSTPPSPPLDGTSPNIWSNPPPPPAPKPPRQSQFQSTRAGVPPNNIHWRVHYGINATKLSSTHAKLLRTQQHSPFTKIVFNFPHVGGLSTDVNRQVRANQELLVGFFRSAIPLLASVERPVRVELHKGKSKGKGGGEGGGEGRGGEDDSGFVDDNDDTDTNMGDDDDDDKDDDYPTDSSSQPKNGSTRTSMTITKGQILVTLFDGAPYTLWNVRDLARHCGLIVAESFAFPWHAYPGYTHARTVGEITTGKDRTAEGKRKGAWRGEERAARCYVLEAREDEGGGGTGRGGGLGTEANRTALGARKGTGKSKAVAGAGAGGSDSGSD